MTKNVEGLPERYRAFIERFPGLGEAHDAVAEAVKAAGPLDARICSEEGFEAILPPLPLLLNQMGIPSIREGFLSRAGVDREIPDLFGHTL